MQPANQIAHAALQAIAVPSANQMAHAALQAHAVKPLAG